MTIVGRGRTAIPKPTRNVGVWGTRLTFSEVRLFGFGSKSKPTSSGLKT